MTMRSWLPFVVAILNTLPESIAANSIVGLGTGGRVIEASVVPAAEAGSLTVILIGTGVRKAASEYENRSTAPRRFRLLVVEEDLTELHFPPRGKAYRDDPASHYLWRWIAMQGPDLVLVAAEHDGGLVDALSKTGYPTLGTVPARFVRGGRYPLANALNEIHPSAVHGEIARRLKRSPAEVAKVLEPWYGHQLPEAVYIPGMALIARLRLGERDDVGRIATPFLDSRDSLANATGSHLAGHLLFAELAARTGDGNWTRLAQKAADLGFNADGSMKQSMPFHAEMSDAVFMGCPILAAVGKLTGETKYFDMAARHFRFMEKFCRRSDGLYRHSPLDEAAWGRGNAFALLGLALTLQQLPPSHTAHSELLSAFRQLAQKLAAFQDQDFGMWRQVIDHRGSYPEFSATAMIGRAILLGIRQGLLGKDEYQPRVDAAWRAVSARIANTGEVMDVCEGTGKQKSLTDYLEREAIWGHDPRGGGMALMFAVEQMPANP